jgi:hypothetical protein
MGSCWFLPHLPLTFLPTHKRTTPSHSPYPFLASTTDIGSLTMKFLGTRISSSSSKNFLVEMPVADGECVLSGACPPAFWWAVPLALALDLCWCGAGIGATVVERWVEAEAS